MWYELTSMLLTSSFGFGNGSGPGGPSAQPAFAGRLLRALVRKTSGTPPSPNSSSSTTPIPFHVGPPVPPPAAMFVTTQNVCVLVVGGRRFGHWSHRPLASCPSTTSTASLAASNVPSPRPAGLYDLMVSERISGATVGHRPSTSTSVPLCISLVAVAMLSVGV